MPVAVVAGATGLIGRHLVQLLLQEKMYNPLVAIARKPLPEQPGLRTVIADPDSIQAQASDLACDDVYCCLGTTMKQAGSREAFLRVDLEYPVTVARLARERGAKRYFLITAMGASEKSSIFYNRVKGQVEREIASMGFSSVHIFRPSMLIGERKDERAGEKMGQRVMTALDFLIPSNYKAIDFRKVANAMVAAAKSQQGGTVIHLSGDMQKF